MRELLNRLLARPPAKPAVDDDHAALILPDGSRIDVRRIRHPRARRLKLSVSERGVRLTLPMRATLRAADAFLLAHRDWIAAQLPKWMARDDANGLNGDTTILPLRGQELPLRRETGRYARARFDDDGIVLSLPAKASDASARRALKEFYLAEARADVGRWLPKYLPSLPRAPGAIRIRPLSSLWGSLSARDALSLDLSLVLGAPAAFEYVLVHELCHLTHRHHRPSYWREVEARGQDWRAQRDYLRTHGSALKARLRGLLGG
ncbi:MAG: M48 family metallopeptidase [Proteobacteria bacterium]|nr:M48 family metallopeptidase [Pseudomonadota bacterium]